MILSVDRSSSGFGTMLQKAPVLADGKSMSLVVSRQQKEITLNIKR